VAIRPRISAGAKASRGIGSIVATGSRIERRAGARAVKVALVDGGSFVLPYDYQLARALVEQGLEVDVFASRTRYNGEFLDAMPSLRGVTVRARAISRTVAPRWRGALAYLGLLFEVWRRRHDYGAVNLQFSAFWPLEMMFLWPLRRRLVFTVHNPVPHGFAARRHRPTARLAALARTLVFVSRFSRDDFIARYGERFRAKAELIAHGVAPVQPGLGPVRYAVAGPPEALVYWSTVKPYKGIEIFAELARAERIKAAGLRLEIHGAWDARLRPLRDELAALGVAIEDRFLDAPRLLALVARNVVFVLPYREASQSGALYSLLNHGRVFLCADSGDLGDFMRRFGLEALLLRERSADAVADALERLRRDEPAIVAALQAAQDASAGAATATAIARVYIRA
jgi:glycosyltransferase involved in cell wall biosynthesis